MAQLRLAFIGCGGFSSGVLLPQIPSIPEIDLVAVCDLQEDRARAGVRRGGARAWYTDAQKMLDAERPDAVAVIGPPPMGVEMGSWCLGQGLHLYVEKPLGRNSIEAEQLCAAARRAGKFTQVGYMTRHAEPHRLARELIQSEEFGTPTYLEARHWQPGGLHPVWGLSDPFYSWLMLHGVHAVDQLRFLFGEVAEVSALRHAAERAGSLVGLVRFASGAVGVLNLHSGASGSQLLIEAVGSRGRTVKVDDFADLTYSAVEDWAPGYGQRQGRFWHRGFNYDRGNRVGYRTELQHFARAVLSATPPAPSVEDAARTTRLCEAIHHSAATGRPVAVADAPPAEV